MMKNNKYQCRGGEEHDIITYNDNNAAVTKGVVEREGGRRHPGRSCTS